MARNDLDILAVFLAVAEERSFTRAGKRLGVSPSAMSHAIRGLEEDIGVRLLSRTTRSVAPTEAGEQLLARLRPALTDVQDYPDVVLDITADDSRLDIVAGGFDAGIHFGEYIQKDMIAVRVSKDHRAAIVGAPSYFKSHPKPKTPHDLLKHRCINFRHGSAGVYRWEFDKGKKSLAVAVNGPLIVVDVETLVRAAIDGIGLAFVSDERVEPQLESGELIRVLEDWCQPFPGFFLYYPSRRQQPAALSALIKTLRL